MPTNTCFCTYARYHDDDEWLCRYCGEPDPTVQKGAVK